MGLKLKRGQQPVATKTHWDYKIPDYNLYDVSDAVPSIVSDKQRAAIEKAKSESLKKRTCTRCGWVEELSRNYRNKQYISGGLCPHCREEASRNADRDAEIEWARQTLMRDDVLILDCESTDLDGEIIELAIINLKREVILNQRFKPVLPVSDGARAIHGISTEMLAHEPVFEDCARHILLTLSTAGLVLIYNAAFDMSRLRQTCKLHGELMPSIQADCLMERYAAFCGDWSDYHGNYKWQPLGGGHDALSDCLAALSCLNEMANVTDNPSSVG